MRDVLVLLQLERGYKSQKNSTISPFALPAYAGDRGNLCGKLTIFHVVGLDLRENFKVSTYYSWAELIGDAVLLIVHLFLNYLLPVYFEKFIGDRTILLTKFCGGLDAAMRVITHYANESLMSHRMDLGDRLQWVVSSFSLAWPR